MSETPAFLLQAMATRRARGLHIRLTGPGLSEPFDAYPKDEAQRDRWTREAQAKGQTVEIVA